MFEGDNSSAQLHRNNRTIYLQLNNGIKTILYKTVLSICWRFHGQDSKLMELKWKKLN